MKQRHHAKQGARLEVNIEARGGGPSMYQTGGALYGITLGPLFGKLDSRT